MLAVPDILLRKSYTKYDCFEVAQDCTVVIGNMGFRIPAGYRTDFASVPQTLWGLFPPHGLAAIPALIHDYMYDNRLFEEELGEANARYFADFVFLELMRRTGVPIWQRNLYYYAVRLGGRRWWRN